MASATNWEMNWTSKQNVSSAALQIKTSEITVHLWSLYFLHFERAIVSREMKRKWVYSPHMSSDIPWEFGCIQFSYCCSKGILTGKKKKKNSQAKSRTFQYRSEELRNHLFFEHKNSGALLSKAERHLLLWICDPWRFSASFLTPPSFRFPEVNAGVIFTEWLQASKNG